MGKANSKNDLKLILPLIMREIGSRYRGSMLGLLWMLLSPLFMLSIYTFVFGVVMKSQWTVRGSETTYHSVAEFGIILFAGLIVNQFFSEVMTSAPNLILNQTNYVKKVVFPLHILPVISLGAALFHACVSASVLIIFIAWLVGLPASTVLLAPLAFIVMMPLMLGISWFVSAIGVYFRDTNQIVPTVLTCLFFFSPILFPISSMPEWAQPYIWLNPLTVPVEIFRNTLIFGIMPEWSSLVIYISASVVSAMLGFKFFNLMRSGFGDVI